MYKYLVSYVLHRTTSDGKQIQTVRKEEYELTNSLDPDLIPSKKFPGIKFEISNTEELREKIAERNSHYEEEGLRIRINYSILLKK